MFRALSHRVGALQISIIIVNNNYGINGTMLFFWKCVAPTIPLRRQLGIKERQEGKTEGGGRKKKENKDWVTSTGSSSSQPSPLMCSMSQSLAPILGDYLAFIKNE